MRATITKQFHFEAAHQLPNHEDGKGKCARVHGHSYRIDVTLEGPVRPGDGGPQEGMVLDFGHVKRAWHQIVGQLDHRFLNDTIGPTIGPTTAENIAGWLLDEFASRIEDEDDMVSVQAITVWETTTSSATVRVG